MYVHKPKTFWDTYDYKTCPRCGSDLEKAISINKTPSTSWLSCTSATCNTYVDTYKPMPHQASVHVDTHRIIGNFGSFGTGKTKTSQKEIEKHILITPNANILLGANISSQYEQTLLRDFELSFPEAFMEGRNQQKAYIDFINGARLMCRPFYDPDNLRSNNYSLAVSLEASESTSESFHTVKNRLRNLSASVEVDGKKYDWRKFIVESNPDSGYIRTDILLVSDMISQFGKFAKEEYDVQPENRDEFTASHIASTDANFYLPADYIKVNSSNKPDWWVRRFIHGSFLFAEGLVYPSAMKCVVPTPPNPKIDPRWKIIIAHDYGLMDEAVFLFGGIDEQRGKLIIYKTVHTNDQSVQKLAELFKTNTKDIEFGQMYCTPLIDPKNNKRDYDKKDLITHYSEYGVHFKPGYVNKEARIYRLNDYIEQGRLEIWDCNDYLIKQLRELKFKPKTLNDKSSGNKAEDKNNHATDPLEWICMELPADPRMLQFGAFNSQGKSITEEIVKYNNGGWQLSSKEDAFVDEDSVIFGIEGGF